MDSPSIIGRTLSRVRARSPHVFVGALALVATLLAPVGAGAQSIANGGGLSTQQTMLSAGGGVASLEECVTSGPQADRAATFSGEMSAVPGTVRMAIRIDVEERASGEVEFHMVSAPGLGVWRGSDPKVKVYKYLKQVTNLSMPAAYRGFVRFRWVGSKGHVIKRSDRLTVKCVQPAPETETVEATPEVSKGAPIAAASPTG